MTDKEHGPSPVSGTSLTSDLLANLLLLGGILPKFLPPSPYLTATEVWTMERAQRARYSDVFMNRLPYVDEILKGLLVGLSPRRSPQDAYLSASRSGKTMAVLNDHLRRMGLPVVVDFDAEHNYYITSNGCTLSEESADSITTTGSWTAWDDYDKYDRPYNWVSWPGTTIHVTPTPTEDKNMPNTVENVTIIPGETGVVINVRRTHGQECHYRGNLPDALDFANEVLRPHVTDDGAPYAKSDA